MWCFTCYSPCWRWACRCIPPLWRFCLTLKWLSSSTKARSVEGMSADESTLGRDTNRPLSLGKLMSKRSAIRLYMSGRERRAVQPGSKSTAALIATFFFPRSLSTRVEAQAFCKHTYRISYLQKMDFRSLESASVRRGRRKKIAGGVWARSASARQLPILKNRTTMRAFDWLTDGLLWRDSSKVRAVKASHLNLSFLR